MHSAPDLRGDLDQAIDDEIAFGRRRGPDQMRLVAQPHMQRIGVGLGIDRDGAHARGARAVRAMRQAISPRLAMRTEENMA